MKTEENINIEEKLSLFASRLLRIGVLTAAAVTLAGGILFFIQHPGTLFAYDTFHSEPARLRQVYTIVREAFLFRSRAVIQFGILILIATPVLRVIFSFIGFIVEKDRMYIVITGIVAAILLYSLFG
jgi:uncharacterized membrane protein